MIEIKRPCASEGPAISALLDSLGYPGTEAFIEARITCLLTLPDVSLLVAVEGETVLGVISVQFIPQLALANDVCHISYFCVSESARRKGVGGLLEERVSQLAQERGCNRIEVHCDSRRVGAHRFYYRQGYSESPKYLRKSLA